MHGSRMTLRDKVHKNRNTGQSKGQVEAGGMNKVDTSLQKHKGQKHQSHRYLCFTRSEAPPNIGLRASLGRLACSNTARVNSTSWTPCREASCKDVQGGLGVVLHFPIASLTLVFSLVGLEIVMFARCTYSKSTVPVPTLSSSDSPKTKPRSITHPETNLCAYASWSAGTRSHRTTSNHTRHLRVLSFSLIAFLALRLVLG